jgi:hypothetical protein
MVVPLILAAGGVGAAAGILGSLAGGLSKKDGITTTTNTTRTSQDVYHAPYETYAPAIQYAPQSSYAYQGATTIINSPNTNANPSQATSLASSPNQTPIWNVPQSYTPVSKTDNSQTSTSGIDWTLIALIGGAAVVGYALLRK